MSLTYENARSYERYKLVYDQVRVDFGQVIALDLGAITIIFQALGIHGRELMKELKKMRMIHHYLAKKKE